MKKRTMPTHANRRSGLLKHNPFEVHINRSKHQVLGLRIKSDHGLPGISKNKALQKRKKTLLQEYLRKDKNNQFIDQRIGERNSSMTEDDRIMARFAAERRRMFNKKAMFNLSDTEVLTHRGQTLSEIERFEDTRSDDDEDDPGSSGALKGKFVENAHFGGGMLTKNKHDRESLIDQLIYESKKRKAERQHLKEETLEATEQLDEEWKTLGMIVTSKSRDTADPAIQKKEDYDIVLRELKFEPQGHQASQRLKTDEEIAKEDKEQLEKLEKERLKQLKEIEANKYGNHRSADDLDDGHSYLVENIQDDDLANPETNSDDSDSSSENDVEMDKEDNNDDDNESGSEDDEGTKENETYSETNEASKEKKYERESNSGDEESDKTDAEIDIETSDDEECAMDDLSDLMPSIYENDALKQVNISTKTNSQKNIKIKTSVGNISKPESSSDLELPHVLKENGVEMDDEDNDSESGSDEGEDEKNEQHSETNKDSKEGNHEKELNSGNECGEETEEESEVIDLDSDSETSDEEECAIHGLDDLMPQIQENISTKAVELDVPYVLKVPDNYTTFKNFLKKYSSEQQNVIFERMVKSNHPMLDPENKKKMLSLAEYVIHYIDEADVFWKGLLVLVQHFNIIREFNKEECLKLVVTSFSTKMDEYKGGFPSTSMTKFLVFYILLFLRPQGLDVLLPVNKPALSLACKLLSLKCSASDSHSNMVTKLLCCYLLLQDAQISSTVYTDAIKYLHNCINVSMLRNDCGCYRRGGNKQTKTTFQKKSKTLPTNRQSTVIGDLMLRLADSGGDNTSARDAQVLRSCAVLLTGFVKAYRKYPQAKILFKPILNSLNHVKIDSYHPFIKQALEELQTLLQVLQSAHLPPVVKVAKKPKALRQYEPSIHTVIAGKSVRDLPAEKREEQKLLHKYKHEMKGAMRELRRDRVFLANIKLREKAQSDLKRKQKVKEIYGSAAAQQGELRSLKRKK